MTAIAISSRREPGPWANQNRGPSPGLERDLIHSLGNSCMVDEPHAPGTKQRGPESRTGPAPTYSAHSAPHPEPAVTAGAGLGAPPFARDSRSIAVSVRTRGGSKRRPGTDPRAETGRARGYRAQTRRPGRASGEGMERVSDQTRVGPPLARRSLGTHRARADRVFEPVRDPSPRPCPRSGFAKGWPDRSSTRRRPGHGPIRRGRFRHESPGDPGDPPTIPNP